MFTLKSLGLLTLDFLKLKKYCTCSGNVHNYKHFGTILYYSYQLLSAIRKKYIGTLSVAYCRFTGEKMLSRIVTVHFIAYFVYSVIEW